MKSRYTFMSEGSTIDSKTNSAFPDPLTLNYLNLRISELPKEDPLNESKVIYFWKEAENMYGSPQYDDLVLTINGISHKNFLKENDRILFPAKEDLERSFSKEG